MLIQGQGWKQGKGCVALGHCWVLTSLRTQHTLSPESSVAGLTVVSEAIDFPEFISVLPAKWVEYLCGLCILALRVVQITL